MRAAKVAVGARSCLVSSCRISHLGAKPVSGGRPPRESKRSGSRAVRAGAFVQVVARVFMFVALFSLSRRKVAMVIAR